MAAPVDPFPNFVPAALTDGDQVDARFTALFVALDRSKPSGGLDAASIKDGIVVPALTVVDPWLSTGLTGNPWGTPVTLEYMKDLMSVVRFKSKPYTFVSGTGLNAGQTIATLPAGYRPGVTSHLRLAFHQLGTSSSSYGWCSVDTSGNIVYQGGTVSFLATYTTMLAGHFRAEN